LAPIPYPQSPIPNPQSPFYFINWKIKKYSFIFNIYFKDIII